MKTTTLLLIALGFMISMVLPLRAAKARQDTSNKEAIAKALAYIESIE